MMGSQLVRLFPGPRVEGVNSIWYGKGPGVDRCGDIFKHANFGGTGPQSAAIILGGDDHNCKSSTLPHQSDFAYMSAGIPILYPTSIQEFRAWAACLCTIAFQWLLGGLKTGNEPVRRWWCRRGGARPSADHHSRRPH